MKKIRVKRMPAELEHDIHLIGHFALTYAKEKAKSYYRRGMPSMSAAYMEYFRMAERVLKWHDESIPLNIKDEGVVL